MRSSGETWVRTAVEDNRISEGAAHMTVKQRFGEKTVIWSANRNANLEAIDQGFQVIHPAHNEQGGAGTSA